MLLIDADIVVMRIACVHEQRFVFPENAHSTPEDAEGFVIRDTEAAEAGVLDFIEGLKFKLGDPEVKLCFTGRANVRKQLFPTYKANRAGKWIPELRGYLTDFLMRHYPSLRIAELEADDLLGILQTERNAGGKPSILCSIDKDLRQIPGWHFNWDKDVNPTFVTPEEGLYMFYYQTLKGDATDGIAGCPRCGDVKARKLLPETVTGRESAVWETVKGAYEAAGKTESDAIDNARMVRILQYGDFELEPVRRVRLWLPNGKHEWKEF